MNHWLSAGMHHWLLPNRHPWDNERVEVLDVHFEFDWMTNSNDHRHWSKELFVLIPRNTSSTVARGDPESHRNSGINIFNIANSWLWLKSSLFMIQLYLFISELEWGTSFEGQIIWGAFLHPQHALHPQLHMESKTSPFQSHSNEMKPLHKVCYPIHVIFISTAFQCIYSASAWMNIHRDWPLTSSCRVNWCISVPLFCLCSRMRALSP